MRARLILITLGILSAGLYAWMLVLSRQFNWGEGYVDRPILQYLALYFGLFVFYLAACWGIIRKKFDKNIFWFIIFFGLLFRCVLLPANQIQEDDVYRYLWDGKVFAHGVNPFEYSPTEVNEYKMFKIRQRENFDEKYSARNDRELALLTELKWENDRSLTVLDRVNHPDVQTIYPPMAQYVFRLVSHIKPDSIIALRIAFLLFDLMALAFIVGILRYLGKDENLCLIYFWSPLLIKETFNSTHLDIIGIAFLCGFIFFMLKKQEVRATLFLAFGFLGKLYPIILFPLYLQQMWSRAQEQENKSSVLPKLAGHVGLFTAVVLLFYAPFLQNGMAIFEGLKTYSAHWQSNDSIFALLLVFYRDGLGLQGNSGIWLSTELPGFFAKATVVLVLVATLIYLMWQKHRKEHSQTDDIFNMFIMMALMFLLSPVQNPWYLCWVIPFLCIFPHRAWLLLTWLVSWYYLDFYFDYQEIQQYSTWIPWFEYPPFYLLLVWLWWKTKNEKWRNKNEES